MADADPIRSKPPELVEHFFRHEAGRLHAVLVRLLGVQHLSLAEDIVQEALLRALRAWSMGGIPPNPAAWITQVAKNLARDALRHGRMAASKEPALITEAELRSPGPPAGADGSDAIADDTLRLMFVCCHPAVAADAQVILALKILCGFSVAEIARAFLSSEAAIERQLSRTKQRIREAGIAFDLPRAEALPERLDGVQAALYLLFNEGHKASAGDRLLREDLCREAIRLASLLAAHPVGDTPRSHALLALMLLTAGRFPARVDAQGGLLRLEQQDRSKWDRALIGRGLAELGAAARGRELSEYHLQAGIAALHCTASDFASTDWPRILRHYDQLAALKASPIVALNRSVAVAHVHGPRAGLDAIAQIADRRRLEDNYLLHAVAGELHWRLGENPAAAEHFRRALQLAQVGPEQAYLAQQLERIDAK
ncbi:MAG TPA: sigma-70 family RNA polymerase sigma factor [Opitutaceae bacterium]|nr:sigma-70 family RNA polymerase sigma factor [Opitutaceae bacterium]